MAKLNPAVNDQDNQAGNKSAIVTLVEYGDYQCPHCGKAYPAVKQLQQEFGEDLNFIFRNFPLQKIHPLAFFAAASTEAAGNQNAFWEMHNFIFENQQLLSTTVILSFAESLHLNLDQFLQDVESEHIKNKIEADFVGGLRSGVNQTPSFFINGEKLEGPAVYITLKNAIHKALNQQEIANKTENYLANSETCAVNEQSKCFLLNKQSKNH